VLVWLLVFSFSVFLGRRFSLQHDREQPTAMMRTESQGGHERASTP
jgi:hypothetical protein